MCIVDLLSELNQNGSFAVLPALQEIKKIRIKTSFHISTFTKYFDEKPGIFFIWPEISFSSTINY